jgi:tyrosine-protein kinase Etk/Wzc
MAGKRPSSSAAIFWICETMTEISTAQAQTRDNADEELDIGRLMALLYSGKWLIAACMVVTILLGILYLAATPYTYSVDALLQIQSDQNSPLSGMSGGGVAAASAAMLFGGQQSAAQSEIPIITSREVLGKTVRDLNLATSSHPAYLPIIGGALADKNAKIVVSRFDVPQSLLDSAFQLQFQSANKYKLIGPEGTTITQGTVGKPLQGKTADGQTVSLFVQSATASNWPATFAVSKRAWLSAVTSLQNNLTVQEKTTGSGVLSIVLEGKDRQKITNIVNSVAQNYVNQNVEARSEQAAQSLTFLKSQLPKLKSKVNTAEARLADYQEKNQPVDLSAQAQALLGQASNLEDKRSKLKLKVAELSQQYTSQYPEVQATRDQLSQLREQSNTLEKHINKLPNSQKQMLGLERDLKVNTELYTALLNRAQELRVAKAGTIGNVRIVDKAVFPVKPVAPRSKLVLFIVILLGLMLGIALVLLRAALRRGVSDPQLIERQTGLAVYAVLPFSNWLGRAKRRALRAGLPAPILTVEKDDDPVAEALRSLRTSLYFAQMEAGSKVLVMTGPSPGVGKSFVSVNLGHLLTQVDQKVIVVDADMRRGTVHEYIGADDRSAGLAELLAGDIDLHTAIRKVPHTELDVISSGAIPSNPSELLMRPAFKQLIADLQARYDLVIVDAPPILAVTDAAIISSAADKPLMFMVLNSGHHPMEEIQQSVERLTRQRGHVTGFILNGYQARKARAAHGADQYQYEYVSKS